MASIELVQVGSNDPKLGEAFALKLLEQNLTAMSIRDIAFVVRADWKKVNYAAKPYLDAMYELSSVNSAYGADSGRSIVNYFLANAQSWRGDIAKAVKKELNRRVK